MHKDSRLLRVGVLGAGPIAQAAHFDACRKARNAALYAICDRAPDLLATMAATHQPQTVYSDYAAMLADPQVEAVIIAAADQYHVDLCCQALAAGKHVLVEKPLGVDIAACAALAEQVAASGLVLQVGNNKRFDPGIRAAHEFAAHELGRRMTLKAWYCDSVYRYSMTDNLQPIIQASSAAQRPAGNPKANRRHYYLLTHGSHLVDTAHYLGGPITAVRARLLERCDAWCWFIDVAFADGALGHLELIVAVRGDWEEGFTLFGERGSIKGKVFLPWFHKASEVECFSTADGQYRRVLGADAYTYKLQIEGWAGTILHGAPQTGASVDEGLAALRALVAINQSVEGGGEWVQLASVQGGL
jgi:predicted dehydrogenase